MSVELLPKLFLHGTQPTFYDGDAVTMLELASRLHGKMNELIINYDEFVTNANTLIEGFINSANQDREVFETELRQEFQDFIDKVDLAVNLMNSSYASFKTEVGNEINEINTGLKNVNANNERFKAQVNEDMNGFKADITGFINRIFLDENYNPNTESLDINLALAEEE